VNRRTLLLPLACLLACAAPRAQGDSPTPGEPKDQQPKKLAEWPALKKTDSDKVRDVAKQFRKKDEELHAPAAEKLVEFGAGAAPILLKMVNDRPNNVNAHLFAVLDRIVDESHAALMAREADRRSVEWRRYLFKRLGRFRDASLTPVLQKALKDADEDVQFFAALGLLALGEGDGIDVVITGARTRWQDFGDEIRLVLEPARDKQRADLVLKRIAAARATEQMAGLRLLRYLLEKSQAGSLRTYLQASDFPVKREAINAARVVHGEEPIEKLASFQAINMAKEWLQKL